MYILAGLLPLLLATTSLVVAVPGRKSFAGTKVIRVTLGPDPVAASNLDSLIRKLQLPKWTDAVKPDVFVDVEVPRNKLRSFEAGLAGYHTMVMHEDLEASITAESFGSEMSVQSHMADASWFTAYHPYADHLVWLSQLVAQYPGHARLVRAGRSNQGRAITGIHIYGSSGPGKKPAAIVYGTVHAREWITTMTAEYTAYALLTEYDNSTQIRHLVDSYDFYVLPIANPDGFLYSQTNNRLWRKTRQPNSGGCTGTDMNRNWPYKWEGSGSSKSTCSEGYRGPSPASSREVRSLAAFQKRIVAATGAVFFMDFHSYGQMWMFPFGYTCNAVPKDNAEFTALTEGAIRAIEGVYGTMYTGGPICNTIYQVNGGSIDYAYEVSGIKYSFTAELRDKGNSGFILPPAQIWETVTETWEGTKYVLLNMK